MPEVVERNELFEVHSRVDAKCSSVRKPSHPLLVIFLGKNVVNFLGEGHFAYLLGDFEVRLGRDRREISVGVLHVYPPLLDHLNDTGLDRKLDILNLLASPRTFDTGRSGWRFDRVSNRSLGVLGYLVGRPNLCLCGIFVDASRTGLVVMVQGREGSSGNAFGFHPSRRCWLGAGLCEYAGNS